MNTPVTVNNNGSSYTTSVAPSGSVIINVNQQQSQSSSNVNDNNNNNAPGVPPLLCATHAWAQALSQLVSGL